jgi:hypothetical protein
MAFNKIDTSDLNRILDYTRFLKAPTDPMLNIFRTDAGDYFNIVRIATEPTPTPPPTPIAVIEEK